MPIRLAAMEAWLVVCPLVLLLAPPPLRSVPSWTSRTHGKPFHHPPYEPSVAHKLLIKKQLILFCGACQRETVFREVGLAHHRGKRYAYGMGPRQISGSSPLIVRQNCHVLHRRYEILFSQRSDISLITSPLKYERAHRRYSLWHPLLKPCWQ